MKWCIRLVLFVVASTIVPDALAADSGSGNFLLNASLGETFGGAGSQHSGYASDTQGTFGLGAGYSWNTDDANSEGLDVGYMDLGTVAPDDPTPFITTQASVTAITAGGHIRHLYGVDKTWVFQARLGLMRASFDENYSFSGPGPATRGSSSWTQTGGYLGFGIGRQINQHLSVILGYDYYSSGNTNGFSLNQSWVGLEAELRF